MNRRASAALTSFITSIHTTAPATTTRLSIPILDSIVHCVRRVSGELCRGVQRLRAVRRRQLGHTVRSCVFERPRQVCRNCAVGTSRIRRQLTGRVRRRVRLHSGRLRQLRLHLRGHGPTESIRLTNGHERRIASRLRETVSHCLGRGRVHVASTVRSLSLLDPLGVVSQKCACAAESKGMITSIGRLRDNSGLGIGFSSNCTRTRMGRIIRRG